MRDVDDALPIGKFSESQTATALHRHEPHRKPHRIALPRYHSLDSGVKSAVERLHAGHLRPDARHDHALSEEDSPRIRKHVHHLHFKSRVRHFTWTWFTMTVVPYRFPGLYAIGCAFFIFNLVLFAFNVVMISLRFYHYPQTFRASVIHPTESLFIPASVISIGTIVLNITEYGTEHGRTGAWLLTTMHILFWVYCGLAVVFSIGIYLTLWSTQTFTVSQMTPVWIFPCYPLLVIAPHAAVLAQRFAALRPAPLPPLSAGLHVIVGGFVLQGIGFLLSLMIYGAYIYRLMTQKLPDEPLRPGMFVSVGPAAFTISGVVSLGLALPDVVPDRFLGGDGRLAAEITRVVATWMGLWLWGLAWWFFFVSVGAQWSCLKRGRMTFAMTFYSYVFPNSALTTATFALARALDNHPIAVLGCVMACILIVIWMTVFGMMIRAVIVKDILWPQKQEDREEGGWTDLNREEPACDVRRCLTETSFLPEGDGSMVTDEKLRSVRAAAGLRESTTSPFRVSGAILDRALVVRQKASDDMV